MNQQMVQDSWSKKINYHYKGHPKNEKAKNMQVFRI